MRTKLAGPGGRDILATQLLLALFMSLACGAQPGSLDASFVPGLSSCTAVSLLSLQPDGKIVYSASDPCMPFSVSATIGRLNPDGSIDSGFASSLFTNGTPHSIARDASGRFIVGGSFQSINTETRPGALGRRR